MRALYVLILSLLTFSTVYAQWTNQNPIPNDNDLTSTFFIDDSTGWIVGSEGFIIKTTNTGLDWIQQTSGTTFTLISVKFITSNIGWICGEGGIILKTTDGGQNWYELINSTAEVLTDVFFTDIDTGWVVGYGGTILKTIDGGSSWTDQNSDSSFDLYALYFVNNMVGYAGGVTADDPKFLKTTDGGIDWIDLSSNFPGFGVHYNWISSIKFLDESSGFVGTAIAGGAGSMWETTDGGENWISATFIYPNLSNKSNEKIKGYFEYGLSSIYLDNSNVGYAVNNLTGPWDIEIYTTTDGGSTWVRKYDLFQGEKLYSVYGNSAGKGWAVGGSGLIFITEDAGSSWAIQGPNLCDIHSVFFINKNIGWAVGRGHAGQAGDIILKTTDGGKIWKSQLFCNGNNGTIRSVYFLDENIGWTVGTYFGWHEYYTTDGGENWNWVWNSGDASIFFIDQNTGWSTTDDKLFSKLTNNRYSENGIYKSTDGGINWSQKSFISSSSIYFSDINNGWAVGEGGSILKSSDSGESWVTKTSGTTNNLNNVKFYNSNLGICVGDNGTVLLTTNGGETWISKNGPTLQTINFNNTTTVWGYTTDGTVYKTTNLGDVWEQLNSGLGYGESAFFVNENLGWVGGLNGIMFKYSTEPTNLPLWSSQLMIEDAKSESSGILTFGQHPEATDSIDTSIGEYEIPPISPQGVFDSRFNLPTNPIVSTLIDFRNTSKIEITWTITFQPGASGYPMTFNWNSTSFPEGTFYLKDRINGSFVNVNMKNQSGYTLTNPAITSLKISYKGKCSLVSVNNGWNIISAPLLGDDMSVTGLFPTAIPPAYGYENGYVTEDTLFIGIGYWLKFGGNDEIQVCGSAPGDTISVKAGWNMIGAYEQDIPLSQVTTTPPGIISTYFFGFEDGYSIADTLKSGKGFWVKVTQDGTLNLNSGTLAKGKEQIAKVEQDWGKIKMTDNIGKSITLYAAEKETESDFYELPPMPPNGIFDARYSSGKLVEDLRTEQVIIINSNQYPITIKVEGLSLSVRDRINGEILNQEIKNGEEIRITNNKITSIVVAGRITGELPISFELSQNYPNPFNPNTTIKFAVPKEVQVNLTVYNILGEQIKELKNEIMKPGYYEVKYDATALASGVYFYRIKTGDFIQTKKMILLK